MTALRDLAPRESIEFRLIPLDRCRKSPGNKRPTNLPRVKEIGAAYDEYLAGAVAAAERDDWYYIIDGWTRVSGARIAGQTHIRALVVRGFTEADDAFAFDKLNTDRTRISAGDEFWARLDYRDPVALAVMDICRELRIEVLPVGPAGAASGSSSKRVNTTRAYGALERAVANHGADVLRDTLRTIREAWPDDPRALESTAISWIANFIAMYRTHPHWSSRHFAEALGAVALITIGQRIHAYEGIRGVTSGRGTQAPFGAPGARAVLLDIYNRRLRARKLPEASARQFRAAALGKNPWAGEDVS